jgi:spoIIIJ-associated protein
MLGANPGQKGESVENSKVITSSGKTVQDAITQGLQQLNLSEDQVEIEIIKEGSRGIFGFGAEDAVVQLTPKVPPTAKPESETSQADVSQEAKEITSDHVTTPLKEAEEKKESPLAPEVDEVMQKRAKEILATLLEKMSVKGEIQVRTGHNLVEPGEPPPLTLDVTGPDLGVLIGKRGETLRALQFVVRQILSKEAGHWIPVVVDIESYLVRRRKSLKQLANRMADRVAFSKRKVVLEPMSAQERRIIHLQLREHEHVYTQSIGDGERRKVVIYPK